MLTSDVLTGHEGVEAAGVEVSVSSSNSLFLELISQGSSRPMDLEPQSSLSCIMQKCVRWKSICETWEKAAVVKIMINQMSRHLVRLVKVCLEFHLCVCWRGWCMLCLFSHGIGDPIHRQSSGGLQFWRSQRPEINNHRNEHTTETHHVHPVFCLRLRWHWTGYGCII